VKIQVKYENTLYISQYTIMRNQSKCFNICLGNKFPLEKAIIITFLLGIFIKDKIVERITVGF